MEMDIIRNEKEFRQVDGKLNIPGIATMLELLTLYKGRDEDGE